MKRLKKEEMYTTATMNRNVVKPLFSFINTIMHRCAKDKEIRMKKIVYSTDINRYLQIDKKGGSGYNRRCIDGKTVGCSNCVGYCQYKGHPGFLTKDQREKHNCIGKGCDYYIDKQKNEKKNKIDFSDLSSEILKMVTERLAEVESVKAIDVKQINCYEYEVYFVAITNELYFEKMIETLSDVFGVKISFVQRFYTFDTCVNIIFRELINR